MIIFEHFLHFLLNFYESFSLFIFLLKSTKSFLKSPLNYLFYQINIPAAIFFTLTSLDQTREYHYDIIFFVTEWHFLESKIILKLQSFLSSKFIQDLILFSTVFNQSIVFSLLTCTSYFLKTKLILLELDINDLKEPI